MHVCRYSNFNNRARHALPNKFSNIIIVSRLLETSRRRRRVSSRVPNDPARALTLQQRVCIPVVAVQVFQSLDTAPDTCVIYRLP